MFPFKSYRQALRVQHPHSGVSGICSAPPLTPQRSHGLQHYPGATQLIMGYISSESLQLLQALSSPTLALPQEGLRLDAESKRLGLSP